MKAVIFPGQGSQYIGMGKPLFQAHSIVRQTFEEAGDRTGMDMAKLVFESNSDQLRQTEYLQPALFTVCVAMYRLYIEQGHGKPAFMAGHSLGELTALACAEAISFCDMLGIVVKRAQLMAHAGKISSGNMLNVWDMPIEQVELLCKEISESPIHVQIACINSPSQIVVSGHTEGIERFKERAEQGGCKTKLLEVSAPFHSSIMGHVYQAFDDELSKYTFFKPNCTIVSNLDAEPLAETSIRTAIAKQLVQPVRWKQVMAYFIQSGVNEIVELGPKQTLIDLLNREFDLSRNIKLIKAGSLFGNSSPSLPQQHLLNTMNTMIRHAVSSKNSNEGNRSLNDLVERYEELVAIRDEVASSDGVKDAMDAVRRAVTILERLLVTKRLKQEELALRMEDVHETIMKELKCQI